MNGSFALQALVVEDHAPTLEVVAQLTRSRGFSTLTAKDYDTARRLLAEERFALAILDVRLPGGSGIDLLLEMGPLAPLVVFITGQDGLRDGMGELNYRHVRFLRKPLEPVKFFALLDHLAGECRSRASRQAHHGGSIAEVEREMITAALARHGGNKTAAARELGISLRTLYNRLAQYAAAEARRRSRSADPWPA